MSRYWNLEQQAPLYGIKFFERHKSCVDDNIMWKWLPPVAGCVSRSRCRPVSCRNSAPASSIPAGPSIRRGRLPRWSIVRRRTSIGQSTKDSPIHEASTEVSASAVCPRSVRTLCSRERWSILVAVTLTVGKNIQYILLRVENQNG